MRAILLGVVLLSACDAPPPREDSALDAGPSSIDPVACLRVPAVIDFGEVATGQRVETQLTLHDRSPFTFVGVQPPFDVQARQQGATTSIVFAFTPPDARLQVQRVNLARGDGCEPQLVELRGLGGGTFEFTRALDFGPLPLAQTATRSLTISNTRRHPVRFFLSTSTPFGVQGSVEIDASSTVEVPVTAHLRDVGPVTQEITLRSEVAGDRFFLIPVTASGGIPRARLLVSQVRVETLPIIGANVGATRRRLWLQNLGDGPLHLEPFVIRPGANSDASELSASTLGTAVLQPNASMPIDLRFFVRQRPGPRSWHVELRSDDPEVPALPIEVSAEAVAVQPCARPVTFSPTSVTLGPPYPSSATVRLTNPNDVECLVDELHVAGLNGWSIASDQLFLPALGSAEFTVTAEVPGADLARFLTIGTAAGYQQVPLLAQ